MSEQGDVVWANGKSWQRDNLLNPHDKKWWINPDEPANLKELKAFKDFRWLVKDGELYAGKVTKDEDTIVSLVKRLADKIWASAPGPDQCGSQEPKSFCLCTRPAGHEDEHQCNVSPDDVHDWDNVKHDEQLPGQLSLWDVFMMDASDDTILRGCE